MNMSNWNLIVKDWDIIQYEYLWKIFIQKITRQLMYNNWHIEYNRKNKLFYMTNRIFNNIKIIWTL